MLFFLDENFPKKAALLLKEKGHDSLDLRGSTNEGATDQIIFSIAQEKGAIFLTTDRDFFHTIPFLWDKHFGIIVIALSQPNSKSILEKLEIALSHIGSVKMESKCILVTDTKMTISPRFKS